MEQDGRWITTKSGNRVFIKNTNEYMNNKIRKEAKEKKQENDKTFQLSDENLQQVIDESISKWDDDYAQLYITKISPDDFLDLTTSDTQWSIIKDESREANINSMLNKKYVADMMYLSVDMQTGEVTGHEGRHRMMALRNAGYKEADIVVWPNNYDKYHTKEYENKRITAQAGTGFSSKYKDFNTTLKKVTPVSKRNVEKIKERNY